MNEEKAKLALALDKMKRASELGLICYTNFFDEKWLAQSLSKLRQAGFECRIVPFGGFCESERRALFFVPMFFEKEDDEKNIRDLGVIDAIKITKDRFCGDLTHRDYLGSLMALGIKREMLGDIIVTQDGAVVFCESSITDFILQNLKSVSRASVKLERFHNFDEALPKNETSEELIFSSSLRVDAILASAFNLSRGSASEAISAGLVFLDSFLVTKSTKLVTAGSKLTYRGHGRIEIKKIEPSKKKNRLKITILK